jgi:hypothetical protein
MRITKGTAGIFQESLAYIRVQNFKTEKLTLLIGVLVFLEGEAESLLKAFFIKYL